MSMASATNVDAFHAAIVSGYDEVVSQLLDHRPELIDVVDRDGMSPLHLAAAWDRHSIVAELFARRQPRLVAVGGEYDMTLLHFAAEYGYDTIVAELLVEQPHLIDAVAGEDRQTALHVAAENGRVKVVHQLLAQRPSLIDCEDSDGRNPLLSAVLFEKEEVVEQLLTYKPELIDAKDKDGGTPLERACLWGLPSTVARLLAHGPAEIKADMLRWALVVGKENDSSTFCEILNLVCAHKPELMESACWDGVLLHHVFGFKADKKLFSEAAMSTVWRLSPPHVLHALNHDTDTPFHVAIKHNNTFAIELVQGKLSLDELLAAFAKCDQKCPSSLREQINECLLVTLYRDVVGTVWEYISGLNGPLL